MANLRLCFPETHLLLKQLSRTEEKTDSISSLADRTIPSKQESTNPKHPWYFKKAITTNSNKEHLEENDSSNTEIKCVNLLKKNPNTNLDAKSRLHKIEKIKKKALCKKIAFIIAALAITILFSVGIAMIAKGLGASPIDICAAGSGSTEGIIAGAFVGIGMGLLCKKVLKSIENKKHSSIVNLTKELYLGD